MAVTIDKDKCIGCGVCVSMLDTVFSMDDDQGIATVASPDGASEDDIREVAEACPVEAITL